MRLTDLIPSYKGDINPQITGVTQDSRRVKDGYLFAALPGSRLDGKKFIHDAIDHGAVAILVSSDVDIGEVSSGIAVVRDNNPRKILAHTAARFYGQQPAFVAAVTGTNGKTSVVHFTQQMWQMLGRKSVSVGTLGVRGEGVVRSGSMTTPDPETLHAELADLAAVGVSNLAIEASSHGLDQCRLDGLQVRAAGFTSFSRDHLDYHKDMDAYLRAKTRLFSDVLSPDGTAVVNADMDGFDVVREACDARNIKFMSYGEKGEDLILRGVNALPGGQAVALNYDGQDYEFTLPLVGPFQVMNALCAMGLVLSEGQENAAEVITCLEKLNGAPGRLELVSGHPKGAVYVDYAHTPDALRHVLEALRPHTQGRLICAVGCGGDRDPGKRPMMGKVVSELADVAIITDDNPRSEDPAVIRKAAMDEAPDAIEIGERREAIEHGINDTKDGDVFVIAGKGHEQGQQIGDEILPFDDVQEARRAIDEKFGVSK